MARAMALTRANEIGCDECFEQMDRFAEMVYAGSSAKESLPLVADHLARCPDCGEEFDALMKALKATS